MHLLQQLMQTIYPTVQTPFHPGLQKEFTPPIFPMGHVLLTIVNKFVQCVPKIHHLYQSISINLSNVRSGILD
jgi:hypothetical protein